MSMTGYSGTPLVKKLGIAEGSSLVLLAPPAPLPEGLPTDLPAGLLADLPQGVAARRTARGRADVVVAFFTRRADLQRRIQPLGRMIFPAGGLWVAWPKRASGVRTDLTDEVVRQVALPEGLVDNKVCAIDETWSGLRVVWRRERRGGPGS
jgi:hypothetical protein